MAMSAFAPTNSQASKYFLPPPNSGPSPPEEYLYGRSATQHTQPSAMMPNTPPSARLSPTDNFNVHYRQLRPQRQPLYVPAALRPTEHARDIPINNRLPDTPPFSQGNSFDSGNMPGSSGTPAITFDAVTESTNRLERELYRLSSENDDSHIPVGKRPTSAHWKPNASTTKCAECHSQFTWWFRRHHCRRCGNVVCENCSVGTVKLDENARFHSAGFTSRACTTCETEWKYVCKLRHSRASSIIEPRQEDLSASGINIPHAHRLAVEQQQRVGSMARSEGGMVWSTF